MSHSYPKHHDMMDEVDEEEIDVEGYDDDDYDDDDDVDLGQGGGAVEARKEHHNKLERKRRLSIKCSFNQLKENIPSLKGEKASRAYILQKAVEHIEEMKAKSRAHATDVDTLSRQNKQLEKEIAEYERIIVQLESMQRQKARERAETAAAATMRLRQQQAEQAAAGVSSKGAGECSSGSSSSGSPSANGAGSSSADIDTEMEVEGEPRRKRTRPASTSIVTIRAESPTSTQSMRPPPAPSEGWSSPSRIRSVSSSAATEAVNSPGTGTRLLTSQYPIRTTVVVRPGGSSSATVLGGVSGHSSPPKRAVAEDITNPTPSKSITDKNEDL